MYISVQKLGWPRSCKFIWRKPGETLVLILSTVFALGRNYVQRIADREFHIKPRRLLFFAQKKKIS
jgi:hypothetical protein